MIVRHPFLPTTLDVHIPIRLKRRGGRKVILTPEGHTLGPTPAQKREPDAPLTKALLKAWKWQKDLESGKAQSMEDIAKRHTIDAAGVSRLMRLNFLAPDLKLAILEGTQPKTINARKSGDLMVGAITANLEVMGSIPVGRARV